MERTPFIAPRSRMRRTSARVSMPAMPTTPWRREVAFERGAAAEVAGHAAALADDEAGQLRAGALEIVEVDAVVADLRIGHRDDLAAVAGIGEDLLVAGHRGVEADLAIDFAGGAD